MYDLFQDPYSPLHPLTPLLITPCYIPVSPCYVNWPSWGSYYFFRHPGGPNWPFTGLHCSSQFFFSSTKFWITGFSNWVDMASLLGLDSTLNLADLSRTICSCLLGDCHGTAVLIGCKNFPFRFVGEIRGGHWNECGVFKVIWVVRTSDVLVKIELDPVGSTVRYEMMKLCTGSVWGGISW